MRAWEVANVRVYLKNSLVLTLSTVIILAIIGTMAAYILARFEFRGRSVLYLYFVIGLMIPVHAVMIPLAFNVGFFQLRDSMTVLILALSAFQIPITLFILTAFIRSIPTELEESALMDGANHFQKSCFASWFLLPCRL